MKTALIPMKENDMFVSHTKHMQRKNNGSTSFAIDNMCNVNFRIYEQESVPWYGEFQNRMKKSTWKHF